MLRLSRATTGVSYVAPAHIANRLCERGRVYLRAWNLEPDMEPRFELPVEQDARGKCKRVTQEQIIEAKKAFAQRVSESEHVWGKHYGKLLEDSNGEKWMNPWHPDLNQR